jgi:hypothetical protein
MTEAAAFIVVLALLGIVVAVKWTYPDRAPAR